MKCCSLSTRIILLVLMSFLLLLGLAAQVHAVKEYRILASADADVSSKYPNTNDGSGIALLVGYDANNGILRSFLKFDVSSIPTNEADYITSVKLKIYVSHAASGPFYVALPDQNWSENAITYNNQPSASVSLDLNVNFPSTGWKQQSLDVRHVQRWLKGIDPNYGYKIAADYENKLDVAELRSRESSSFPETLVVVTDPPPPPDFQPNGISWTPVEGCVGQTVNFDVDWKNNGPTYAGTVCIGIYISEDQNFDPNYDRQLDDLCFDGTWTQGVQNQSRVPCNISNSVSSGCYYVYAYVDDGNYIPETNESNNIFGTFNQDFCVLRPPPPPTLSGPSTACTNTQYCLTWNSVSGATSYEIQENGGGWTDVGNVTQKCYTQSNTGNYCYYVRAKNSCGTSGNSNQVCVQVNGPPSPPPTLSGSSTACTNNQYCLTWNSVSGATSYEIRENGGSWTDVGDVTQNCYAKSSPGTYCYYARAKNSCGTSGNSNQVCVQVNGPPTPPPTLSGPSTACTNTQYCLTWNSVSGATSYEIQENGGGWTDVGNVTQKCYTKSLTGSYCYYVQAKNGCGISGNSNQVCVQVNGPPPTPGQPTVTAGCGYIDVSWGSVSGATSYCIYRDGNQQICQSGTTWRDNNPGTSQRCYRITAKNDCPGESGQSPQTCDTAKTKPDATTLSPTVLPLHPAINEKYTISWDTIKGATYYVLYENNIIVYSGPSTPWDTSSDTTGELYYHFVACNSCGCDTAPNPFVVHISPTDVSEIKGLILPDNFSMGQNYPNPFNPNTEMQFAIPRASHVLIEVFDINGRRKAIIVDQLLSAGQYIAQWDGRDMHGHELASGVYLYRMQAGEFAETKKMILLK